MEVQSAGQESVSAKCSALAAVPDKPFRRSASMSCTRHPGIISSMLCLSVILFYADNCFCHLLPLFRPSIYE